MAARQRPGFTRIALILVIVLTSISTATFYLLLRANLYTPQKASDSGYFFKSIAVFDGESDKGVVNVRIKNGAIDCMGKDCQPESDDQIIDGAGKSLIPGLADLHIHFYAPSTENSDLSTFRQLFDYIRQRPLVRQNLHNAGVTTVRSVGDITANILKLREQIQNGDLAGSEVFCVGPLFTAPGGHPAGTIYKGNDYLVKNGTRQVSDTAAARTNVATLADMGVNGIKAVYDDIGGRFPKLDQQVLKSIIDEAHSHGLWVTIHTGTADDVQTAVMLGADAIEHGTEERLPDSLISRMVQQQVLYIPTLAVTEVQNVLEKQPGRKTNIARLDSAGVMIGAGTDTQGKMAFGSSLHRELELLVEAGLSPSHALRAATWYAAISLKTDHRKGRLEPGKEADCVLINGKPWVNISDIRKVEGVWQKGVRVK
ncbi:MAG: amidohydrolase family protein [Bacteroidia bacterium]